MIVVSLSDSLCSARQRGKGVSERSELGDLILSMALIDIGTLVATGGDSP